MYCHKCEHREAIESGKYRDVPYENTPCSTCELAEYSQCTVAFNEEQACPDADCSGESVTFDESTWTVESDDDGGVAGDGKPLGDSGREEMLPIDVMREIVAGLLLLKPELRDVVAWRYAGVKYEDIAKVQGVTMACAEKRHRRAMELWPVLESLFPRKVAKREKRKRSALVGV